MVDTGEGGTYSGHRPQAASGSALLHDAETCRPACLPKGCRGAATSTAPGRGGHQLTVSGQLLGSGEGPVRDDDRYAMQDATSMVGPRAGRCGRLAAGSRAWRCWPEGSGAHARPCRSSNAAVEDLGGLGTQLGEGAVAMRAHPESTWASVSAPNSVRRRSAGHLDAVAVGEAHLLEHRARAAGLACEGWMMPARSGTGCAAPVAPSMLGDPAAPVPLSPRGRS